MAAGVRDRNGETKGRVKNYKSRDFMKGMLPPCNQNRRPLELALGVSLGGLRPAPPPAIYQMGDLEPSWSSVFFIFLSLPPRNQMKKHTGACFRSYEMCQCKPRPLTLVKTGPEGPRGSGCEDGVSRDNTKGK